MMLLNAMLALAMAVSNGARLAARVSYYNPALCAQLPINCLDPDNPFRMAAGHDARDWVGRALACPPEFPIGSVWSLPPIHPGYPAQDWVCLDRGGRIQIEFDEGGGLVVALDLLVDRPVVTGEVTAHYHGPAVLLEVTHADDHWQYGFPVRR